MNIIREEKVNHKLRNVITVVIGNDEKYKGKLAANIDGSYGMDGEYKEYHHIGFDIEANKILKEIESYADSKNGEKIYWITGYGQGGSIANLVGAKLTDKVGESKVYCYTIESFATINANKIVNKNNFGRGRYKNIFNLENRDDLMIKLLDRDIGWFKYGRSVRGSAEKLKKEIVNIYGDNFRGSSGKVEYRGSPKVVSEIINGIKETIKNIIKGIGNRIFGLSSSIGPTVYEENKGPAYEKEFVSPISPRTYDKEITPDNIKEKRQIEHKTVAIRGVKNSESIGSINVSPILDSNMLEVGKMTNSDKKLEVESEMAIVAGNNVEDKTFRDIYDMSIKITKEIDYDYQKDKVSKEDWCIKLGDFKYSNYTIPYGEYITYDLNYSQFWDKDMKNKNEIERKYGDYNKSHYYLYENDAGDFNKKEKTKMLFGRYHKNNKREEYVDKNYDSLKNIYNKKDFKCDVVTIDGRIITAAPLNLLIKTIGTDESGEDELIKDLYYNQMHEINNYPNGNFTNKDIDKKASSNKQYKYMDLVVESKDGYQYVIPFMVVDVKWLHVSKNHYSHLTDNAYGHVFENAEHKYSHMNPLEPYIKVEYKNERYNEEKLLNSSISTEINNALQNYIIGKDKIISMRLYDKKHDDTNNTTKSWWKKLRDGMEEKTTKEYKENYIIDTEKCKHNGIIVKYK